MRTGKAPQSERHHTVEDLRRIANVARNYEGLSGPSAEATTLAVTGQCAHSHCGRCDEVTESEAAQCSAAEGFVRRARGLGGI